MTPAFPVEEPDTDTSRTHNLLFLLPGETFEPGKTTAPAGRLGTPNFTAVLGHAMPNPGDTFPVTVLAVDQFYNRVFDTDNPQVRISADPNLFPTFSPSATFALASGSATVNVTIKTATTTMSLTVNETLPVEFIEYST